MKCYIGGRWEAPAGDGTFPVVNPATEQVITDVAMASASDVDRAVQAARSAYPEWAATSPAERAAIVAQIGKLLHEREADLAECLVAELGMPKDLCLLTQAAMPAETFVLTAAAAESFGFEQQAGQARVRREPAGVAGAITPWNFPLAEIASKTAPALCAGCTVVVKPSEVKPLAALQLAEAVHAAGLPSGVFNLLVGNGLEAGEALAGHRDVDIVSFTGSTKTGRRVAELAARNVTRSTLELGGKSPNVLLADADIEQAVPDGVFKAFLHSGQACSALTRMIVPRGQLARVEELAAEAAAGFVTGDPAADGVTLGPVVSAAQHRRVQGYIRAGMAEGARLVTGGPGRPSGLDRGYYVRPTVFSGVGPGMVIAQEEIFGPVLAILPYDSEDEAVEIANGTIYGLAAAVWSADTGHALEVAGRLRAGQVEINEGAFEPMAPFGGCKQSGYGRESGHYGLAEFTEIKALLTP